MMWPVDELERQNSQNAMRFHYASRLSAAESLQRNALLLKRFCPPQSGLAVTLLLDADES